MRMETGACVYFVRILERLTGTPQLHADSLILCLPRITVRAGDRCGQRGYTLVSSCCCPCPAQAKSFPVIHC